MLKRVASIVLFAALVAAAYDPNLDEPRFTTNRKSAVTLALPEERDSFVFAVFGDRTGGPPEGLSVLEQAVADVNLLHPDLVMTVGDLIQGYNDTPQWLAQKDDYKRIMARLKSPWFPVSGNHDIYWRGDGPKPAGEHESNYEQHFGPLWYAFEHKDAWFIALHSDESNPQTGEKNFNKPECQRMSDEQYSWLAQTLETAKQAKHVFLFLHHPRWLKKNYGEDWERVHELLKRAGNVTAVFAGHIHHMRWDGKRDGIEYFTLATVGGDQSGLVPAAGYLHQYSLVTVRDGRIDVAAYPVGGAIDPRAITGEIVDQTTQLAREFSPQLKGALAFTAERAVEGRIEVELRNPSARSIEVQLAPESDDSRWNVTPDHAHLTLKPGASARATLRCTRPPSELDASFRMLELSVHVDYLAENARIPLPRRLLALPFELQSVPAPAATREERVLALDGADDHLALPDAQLALPDGPFTLEGWVRAERFKARQGVICKTEQSEFGIFANHGEPEFTLNLGGKYVTARSDKKLAAKTWTHLAGVFDGENVRLYVDGVEVASRKGKGSRKRNALPLVIGGDVGSDGAANSLLEGALDEVRISSVARYAAGESFKPAKRFESDAQTLLLLHMDAPSGPWCFDHSPKHAHALVRGGAAVREP
ncbi:MAG: metallophosphoesterase [Planctomycetes bacterium]|nr:metallophosphoesterase [Planctomycetota bacterium]